MRRGQLSFSEAVKISRPSWWLVTSLPFVIGAWLATEELSITLVLGVIYFTFPYNLLLYGVNDIFDYETDIKNERKSGVVHGTALSRLKHPALWRLIGATNLPFVLYFAIVGNLEATVFLIMMNYMVLAYSVTGLRYKEIPFIDSLTSGFHYASPFLFGLFVFRSPDLWAPAFAAYYFWAVGSHAFAAIQDITPDRQAGIKTIATYLGAGKTLVFSVLAYGLAITAPLLGYGLFGFAALAAISPFLLLALLTYRYRFDDQAPQFKLAWRRSLLLFYIVGFIGVAVFIYLQINTDV